MAAIPKAMYVDLVVLPKINDNDKTAKKIKIGSIIPNNEFMMILGSKIKIPAAINAYCFSKNRLASRQIGIIVNMEIIVDSKRCKFIKSKKLSDLTTEKNNERNVGQPLLGKLYPSGNLPNKLISIAYQ